MVVVPELVAVTTPPLDIVPTEVALLLHVPPVVVELKAIVPPAHIFVLPVMVAGNG